jgi:cytochrome c
MNHPHIKTSTIIAIFTAFTALSVSTTVMADLKLATDKNCMTCHSVEKKLVGPSFKNVATKYTGQKDAIEILSNKILKGSAGVWGPIPMPSNTLVNVPDAKTLATWVMSLK